MTKPFTLAQLSATIARYVKPTVNAAVGAAEVEKPAPAAAGPATEPTRAADIGGFDENTLRELQRMQSGDKDLVGRALDLFLTHSKDAMLRLARALRARDAKEIASAAHALKSMSFNVGARALGDACSRVERQSTDFTALPSLLRDVRREYAAAIDAAPSVRARFARAAA